MLPLCLLLLVLFLSLSYPLRFLHVKGALYVSFREHVRLFLNKTYNLTCYHINVRVSLHVLPACSLRPGRVRRIKYDLLKVS